MLYFYKDYMIIHKLFEKIFIEIIKKNCLQYNIGWNIIHINSQ